MSWRRERYQWRIRGREIALGGRTLVMGVLDVSAWQPRVGGTKAEGEAWLQRALDLEAKGADLIDLTAMGEKLATARISADDELRRMVPILRKLRHNIDVPVSVQTYNAETANRALELGAEVINDLSGLSFDPQMPETVCRHGAGLILGHARGTPDTWRKPAAVAEPLVSVVRDLQSGLARARMARIDDRFIAIDPGLGYGKRRLENYEILRRLEDLIELRHPVLVSPSRKPFLTESIRAPEADWLYSAAAAATVAVAGGAHIVRTHEVAETVSVVRAADRFFEAGGE